MLKRVKQQLRNQKKGSSSKNTKKNGEEEEQSYLVLDPGEISDDFCGTAIALIALESDQDIRNEWILDSDLTVHITNNRSRLRNMKENVRWLLVGDTRIKMIGPSEATLFPTDLINHAVRRKGIRLLEVWFVEGMHTNLISASKLQKNSIQFDGKKDRLWSEKAK